MMNPLRYDQGSIENKTTSALTFASLAFMQGNSATHPFMNDQSFLTVS
ncbi:hypothetical protein CEV32_1588 [Brucella rhizosphaerae]|uniref:Uncharacterized protein n=1 Tax=Brucella rhizosphaerae TaxID=571254 RepID=A0A256F981_9HYPH|nr:hypothetical protein CEV32_1588 [Brucella rhizosphaerae]